MVKGGEIRRAHYPVDNLFVIQGVAPTAAAAA